MVIVFFDVCDSTKLKAELGAQEGHRVINARLKEIEDEFRTLSPDIRCVGRPGDAVALCAPLTAGHELALEFLKLAVEIQRRRREWANRYVPHVRVMLGVGDAKWIGTEMVEDGQITGNVVDLVLGRLQKVCPKGGVVFEAGMALTLREFPREWLARFREDTFDAGWLGREVAYWSLNVEAEEGGPVDQDRELDRERDMQLAGLGVKIDVLEKSIDRLDKTIEGAFNRMNDINEKTSQAMLMMQASVTETMQRLRGHMDHDEQRDREASDRDRQHAIRLAELELALTKQNHGVTYQRWLLIAFVAAGVVVGIIALFLLAQTTGKAWGWIG